MSSCSRCGREGVTLRRDGRTGCETCAGEASCSTCGLAVTHPFHASFRSGCAPREISNWRTWTFDQALDFYLYGRGLHQFRATDRILELARDGNADARAFYEANSDNDRRWQQKHPEQDVPESVRFDFARTWKRERTGR